MSLTACEVMLRQAQANERLNIWSKRFNYYLYLHIYSPTYRWLAIEVAADYALREAREAAVFARDEIDATLKAKP